MARQPSLTPGRGGWGRLSKVIIPSVFYNSLPASITRNYSEWPHDSGSFLYNNQDYFWAGGMVDLQGLFNHGADGYDHSLYDFFSIIVPYLFNNIIYDPEGNYRHAVVYKDEWAKVGKVTVWTFQTGAYRTIPGANVTIKKPRVKKPRGKKK